MSQLAQAGFAGRGLGWIAAALLLASAAPAQADPIAGGKTRLTIDKRLSTTLRERGVRISKLKQARFKGRTATLPVTGFLIDLGSASGTITHDGALRLRSAAGTVVLREITLDTAKRSLRVRVDGERMRFAGVKGFGFARDGFGDRISVARLPLSGQAASLLNHRLHLRGALRKGLSFAGASSEVRPEYDSVKRGSLIISLDPGTVAKLASIGVEPAPFEAQVLGGEPPTYSSPLIGGAIYPRLNRGFAQVETGLRLTREPPSTQLLFAPMTLDLETNRLVAPATLYTGTGPTYPGSGVLASLDMSGATATVDQRTRTATIDGLRATLEASSAELINQTLATSQGKEAVLAAGDPLGTFSLTMVGR